MSPEKAVTAATSPDRRTQADKIGDGPAGQLRWRSRRPAITGRRRRTTLASRAIPTSPLVANEVPTSGLPHEALVGRPAHFCLASRHAVAVALGGAEPLRDADTGRPRVRCTRGRSTAPPWAPIRSAIHVAAGHRHSAVLPSLIRYALNRRPLVAGRPISDDWRDAAAYARPSARGWGRSPPGGATSLGGAPRAGRVTPAVSLPTGS